MAPPTVCRTCGFIHPEADCPRWPAPDAELPWLGDIDRRADDDVEFAVEGSDY
jgi:hypothetical protein